MNSVAPLADKAKSGIWGLDNILSGGFSRGHLFLVEGAPGTGKTTVALQFLLEGINSGEKCLYITLSETARELREGAASHGWSLDAGIEVFELLPPESLLDSDQQQSLLYSSDLELGETTKQIFEAVERARPDRVVLDSLSEIRLLAQSSLRYRRQILAIKHYFARFSTTVVLLDDLTAELADKTVHSVAHGVLRLEELAPAYGAERRRARVIKYRGVKFRGGYHDATITTGGLNVFPRLVASEHRSNFTRATMTSGIDAFDKLLGGGVEAGSSTLVLGPPRTRNSLDFQGGHDDERHRRFRQAVGRRRRSRLQHAGAGPRRHRKVADGHRLCSRRDLPRREGRAVRVRRRTRSAVRTHERTRHRS